MLLSIMPQSDDEKILSLQREIESLKQSVRVFNDSLKKQEGIIKTHRHLGVDGTSPYIGDTKINASEINITSGIISDSTSPIKSVLNILDNVIGSTLGKVTRRLAFFGMFVNNKGGSGEQIDNIIGAGITPKNPPQNFDFAGTLNLSQLQLLHQPQSAETPPYGFFSGLRTPQLSGTGSIVNGGTVLTDTTLNLVVDALAGCTLDLFVSGPGAELESYKIVSNTATTVTIVDGTWASATGSYSYYIYTPLFLGSADIPWRRIFVGGDVRSAAAASNVKFDLRIGDGPSGGSKVIWVAHGTGSPESVVTANIGSLYLRTNGGASTTLYIKESGTGNTGWAPSNPGLGASYSLQTVTAGFTIAPSAGAVILIAASAVTSSVTTAISSPTSGLPGRVIILEGTSNTNTITIKNGANTTLAGAADCVLGAKDTLTLFYDSGGWVEITRSNN